MTTMGFQRLAAAVVLAGAIAVAGCGGGGSDDASTTDGDGGGGSKLTHAALVSHANAICRTASAGISRLPLATTLEDLAGYAGSVEAIGTRLHQELSRLTPPAGDRVNYNRYLEALATSNEQLRAMQAAASRSDSEAVRTAVSRITGAEVGLAAANAGFGICASATPAPSS
jgi:hypothetical protein